MSPILKVVALITGITLAVVFLIWWQFTAFASFFINSVPYQIAFFSSLGKGYDYVKAKAAAPFTYWSPTPVYDFIVVGGGSAGAVVANRLSKHNTVLLLEAGGNPSWYGSVPFFTVEVALTHGTSYAYTSTPQEFGHLTRKGIVRIPRGKGLGGSSSVNGMIFIRGSPKTFDEWAEIAGDDKWSYKKVLPFFKKLENYQGDFQPMDTKYHDVGGELHLETQSFQPQPVVDFVQAALKEKGYHYRDSSAAGPKDKDYTRLEHNMKRGARHGTYEAFLKPIRGRSTLTILRYAEGTRIHLDANNRAYGVSYLHHGSKKFARARREVILSAGVIESPKLLMRSGIGPCDHLRELRIKCVNDLPVGQNLHDHPLFTMVIAFNDTVSFMGDRNLTLGSIWNYFRSGTGPLRSLGLVTTAYRSTPRWDVCFPDIQFQFYGGFLRPWGTLPVPYRHMDQGLDLSMVTVSEYLPKSTGELRLASKRRMDQPLINPNYYKDPSDVSRTIQGIKYAIDLFEGSAVFKQHNASVFPVPEQSCDSLPYRSDEYWECHVRGASPYVYHPVGTVSMGNRCKSSSSSLFPVVVDSDLRVLNMSGLRVIDASIIPKVPNVNIHGSVLLIGELGAYIIRSHWATQYEVCPTRPYWQHAGTGISWVSHHSTGVPCTDFLCSCWRLVGGAWHTIWSPVTRKFGSGRGRESPDELMCFYTRLV